MSCCRYRSAERTLDVYLQGSTSHFVHLAGPYMAMWLASRPQLETWQKSPQWSAQRNGYHGNPSREDAAQGLYGMQVRLMCMCAPSSQPHSRF